MGLYEHISIYNIYMALRLESIFEFVFILFSIDNHECVYYVILIVFYNKM